MASSNHCNQFDIGAALDFAIQNGLSERSTIDEHVVRKKLQRESKEAYEREMKLWNSYTIRFPESDPRNMRTMKHFAEVVGMTTPGRLDKTGKATTWSVRNKMRRFYNMWERDYKVSIPEEVKLSVAPYVDGELADKLGLSREKRRPTFLTIANYVHLQEQLWTRDHHDYVHEGSRVDSANLLNTHCFTSARLREVCQAVYKDIICMVGWKDGEPEFKVDFKREHTKGMQDTPKKPEHPLAEKIEGEDGPPPLFAQPILHWLANFLSAQAFRDFKTVDQILALTPRPGESYRILDWADDKRDQPVFPEWTAEGPKDKPKSPKSWGTQASAWAVRAGFTEGMGLHASRREALIKVDDNGYSMGQVMKFAAHRNPRTLVGHYLADMTNVDGTASFLGLKPRRDLTEDFRSASMRREPNLPSALPAKLREALQSQPDYSEITSQIKALLYKIDTAGLGEDRKHLIAQRDQLYRQRSQLVMDALETYQQDYSRVSHSEGEQEAKDWRRVQFDRVRHMMPERGRLADSLPTRVAPRSDVWVTTLRDLIALRTNNCRVAYQEALRPSDGRCPVAFCGQEMDSSWITNRQGWENHCQRHLDSGTFPLRCNPVIFRHAVACAGYCPACLRNTLLPASQRMRQFLDLPAWKRHISRCVSESISSQENSVSIPCLYISCSSVLVCRSDLIYHLDDAHGIEGLTVRVEEKWTSNAGRPKQRSRRPLPSDKPIKSTLYSTVGIDTHAFSESWRQEQETLGQATVCAQIDDHGLYELSLDTPRLLQSGFPPDTMPEIATPAEVPDILSSTRGSAELPPFGEPDEDVLLTSMLDPRLSEPSVSLVQSSLTETLSVAGTNQDSVTSDSAGENQAESGHAADVAMETPVPLDAEQDIWQVEKLLAKWKQGRTVWYLVKWQGFENKDNSWEVTVNISPEMVKDFDASFQGNDAGVELIDKRLRNGKSEYLVKWLGRPQKENSWLRAADIRE
ncbi:hypothetical protein PG996_005269 [Apiospora saccharicola]|uniref:Chromo domain-containing protein n=1 Tax=Apiospora saccharicola TaxID=335842 RepID=A0ABR1VL04_9PEZI